MIGTDAPMVSFKQDRKVVFVPAGRGVSAAAPGAAVLLSAGALEGRFALSL